MAPGLLDLENNEFIGLANGSAVFEEATYTGPSTIQTEDGALTFEGAPDTTFTADEVTVTYFHQERTGALVTHTDEGLRTQVGGYDNLSYSENFTTHAYDHQPTLTVQPDPESDQPEPWLAAWPNETLDGARFHVALDDDDPPPIAASKRGETIFSFDNVVRKEMSGPVFALAHGEPEPWITEPTDALFETIGIDGDVTFFVPNGIVEIHEEGEAEADTFWNGDRDHRAQEGNVKAQAGTASEVAYSLVTLHNTSSFLAAGDNDAALFTHEPSWQLNGTLTFEANDGELHAGNNSSTLDNDTVVIEGNTSLEMAVEGEDDDSSFPDWVPGDRRQRPERLPTPTIGTTLSSDAERIDVEGQTLKAADGTSLSEGASLVAQILGALLVAWSVGRKFLFLAVGLFIEDPLDSDRREEIYRVLQTRGMAHQSEIQDTTDIPRGSLQYHLEILRDSGLVTSFERAGQTVYFPLSPTFSREEMKRLALLTQPTRRQIAHLLVGRGPSRQADIADELDVTQATVSRQLAKLAEAGLVVRNGDRNARYEASPLLEAWLQTGEAETGYGLDRQAPSATLGSGC